MKSFFSYWLWPNPAGWNYSDTKVIAILVFALAFILGSFLINLWRNRQTNAQTKILSSSWSRSAFWFGIFLLFLTVSRVEMIQFMSMRLLFPLWVVSLVAYIAVQVLQFRRRHYTVLGRTVVNDERRKYLPRKK